MRKIKQSKKKITKRAKIMTWKNKEFQKYLENKKKKR